MPPESLPQRQPKDAKGHDHIMIFSWNRLLGGGDEVLAARPRLALHHWPAAVYAIGDVHGCLAQLRQLHDKIFADAATIAGDKLIICCGDYIDRGPDSAGVLDYLNTPLPAGFRRVCLAGNHEVMMLEHVANPRNVSEWFKFGGVETLLSYGLDIQTYLSASPRIRTALLLTHIPDYHLTFLRNLPVILTLPGAIFVHAGIRPGVPLDRQTEGDLLWIRDAFFDAADGVDGIVVHGHTPAADPVVTPHRICVDTGAFATGTLTAVRLVVEQSPEFIKVTALGPRS
ncbi:MAG: metallophosphoesterase family protein [Devosia sp.]